jgi:hypothetical protein
VGYLEELPFGFLKFFKPSPIKYPKAAKPAPIQKN